MKKIVLAQMNPEIVAQEIGEFIAYKIAGAGATNAVIGLSGGIDSTVAAALTKKGIDDYNQWHHSQEKLGAVFGYSLPSSINSQTDNDDGKKVAQQLGIHYELISLEPIIKAHKFTNAEVWQNQYDKGNMISRIRANVLNTKAASNKAIVIGTGNKDEDFGIGYYTLFGDGAVHCSPIGGLPKRLVREMAEYLGFSDYFVNRTPSAGLEPGQTDFKDLGYTYGAVEVVTYGSEQGFYPDDLYVHPQVIAEVQPFLAHSKFDSVSQVVDDILHRHSYIAGPKAHLVSPEIAQITLEYR